MKKKTPCRQNTNDAERPGKPKDVTITEIIQRINDIILDDPKVKVHELAEAADINWVSDYNFA